MILSTDVLNKIEFYEAVRFSANNHSTIRLHWKKEWWQFWKHPTLISFKCRCSMENGNYAYHAEHEWEELSDQLREYFLNKTPKKGNAQLYLLKNFKKDDNET